MLNTDLFKLMNRIIITINGDMDFSSYTKEEKEWIKEYSEDYKPKGYKEVIKALNL